MGRNRLEKQLYYGFAILIVLFIVVGLKAALRGDGEDIRNPGGITETAKMEEISGTEKLKKTEKNKRQEKGTDTGKGEKTQADLDIRVLLMTDGYQDIVHPEVSLSSSSELTLSYGKKKEKWKKGKKLLLAPDDPRFKKGSIRIKAKKGNIRINSLNRGYGTPVYEGILELYSTAEGIVIINELSVEKYLCGVVPSEMPSSYELEALKAQAVCARSYAYRQMESCGYPEYNAHVNDSTDYQVYGNSEPAESTRKAVKETEGEVVKYNGQIVTTYYYSTSCGKTTSAEAWGSKPGKANGYLKSVKVKGEDGYYEKELPWYRWEASVPVQVMSDLVGLNTETDVGTLKSIKILKTGPGGIALKIRAEGDRGSVTVETENKIRRALGGYGYVIHKQDGTDADSGDLLPSAFFTIKKSGGMFVIKGGGFGHGIGMSQNGANEMAKSGKDYKEILTLFYQGVTIEP